MKQRTRIRRIKARTYPNHIYFARQRRRWAEVCVKWRKLRDAMIEAYTAGRKAYEMSEMREGRQEPSA
jgi:hypothetical protein